MFLFILRYGEDARSVNLKAGLETTMKSARLTSLSGCHQLGMSIKASMPAIK